MTDQQQTKAILEKVEATVDASVGEAVEKYVDNKISDLHKQFNERMDTQDDSLKAISESVAGLVKFLNSGGKVLKFSMRTVVTLGKLAASIAAIVALAKYILAVAFTSK